MGENHISTKYNLILISICIGAFGSHFSAGIINIALPELTDVFHQSIDMLQWITTGYLLVIVALLPLMGKLGDRLGQRTVHNTGLAFFAAGTLFSAFSANLWVLLFFRGIQGMGAAMYQATNIALITKLMPKNQRGKSLGILSTVVGIGAMSGPLVGGFIIQLVNWHWLFLIQLPSAFISVYLAYKYIPKDDVVKAVPIDGIGAVLFALSVSCLVFAVSSGNSLGWLSPGIIACIIFSVMAWLMLTRWVKKQEHPFLPLQVLNHSKVRVGIWISLSTFFISFSAQVLVPFYLMDSIHLKPVYAGYVMLAYPICMAISGPVAGSLSDRHGTKVLSQAGLVCMAVSSLFMVFTVHLDSFIVAALVLVMMGIGMGIVTSPNYSLIMSHVPAQHLGTIGGMVGLSRNVGMVFGAALGLGLINFGELNNQLQIQFGLNAFICFSCILLFYFTDRLNKMQNIEQSQNM